MSLIIYHNQSQSTMLISCSTCAMVLSKLFTF